MRLCAKIASRIYQMRKNEYTHETLYKDIKKLDEIQHNGNYKKYI